MNSKNLNNSRNTIKHVVFKTHCPEDISLISSIDARVWFTVCYFTSSLSYFMFRIKYGNSDVMKSLIEQSYDLTNSTTDELKRNNQQDKRIRDVNWVLIEKHLPKD